MSQKPSEKNTLRAGAPVRASAGRDDVERDPGLALGDLPEDVDLLLQFPAAEDRAAQGQGRWEP